MRSRSISGRRPSIDPGSAAALFAALGDETRMRLVTRLGIGDTLSIADLAEDSGLTRQAITKHLHVLEGVGLAMSRKEGRERHWRLNTAQLSEARRCLDLIASRWGDALGRLKATLERD